MSAAHRAYFNRVAPEWERHTQKDPVLREYLERFGIGRGERVLDIGSGTGCMTRHLLEMVGPEGTVVAEDIAEEMLFRNRDHFPGLTALKLCDDVYHLALKSGSFDKVLCFSAFPHFRRHGEALSEMKRVLAPGGRLLILHTGSSRSLNLLHEKLDGVVNRDFLPPVGAIAPLLEETGLRVLRAEETDSLYWLEALKP